MEERIGFIRTLLSPLPLPHSLYNATASFKSDPTALARASEKLRPVSRPSGRTTARKRDMAYYDYDTMSRLSHPFEGTDHDDLRDYL